MSQPRITIIGAGRMGQGLGLALKRRGYRVLLVNRSVRDVIAPLILHQGSLAEATSEAELAQIDAVIAQQVLGDDDVRWLMTIPRH